MEGSNECRKEEGRNKELARNTSTPGIKGKIETNIVRKRFAAEKTGDVDKDGRKLARNSQGRNRKTGVSSIMDLIGRFNKLDKAAGNEVARNKGRNMKGGEAEGEEDNLPETAMKPLAQGETARNQVSVMPLTLSREAARNVMVEAAKNQGRNMVEAAGSQGRSVHRGRPLEIAGCEAARNQGRNVNKLEDKIVRASQSETAKEQGRNMTRLEEMPARARDTGGGLVKAAGNQKVT